jgi:hypothetical protein
MLHHGTPPGNSSFLSMHAPYENPLSPGYQEALNKYFQEVLYLKALIEANGSEMLFVLFPSHAQIESHAKTLPQEFLAALIEKNKIWSLDLTPLLQKGGTEKELYFVPLDRHPKPRAYEISGKFIAREIAHHYSKKPISLPSDLPLTLVDKTKP